MKRTLPCGDYAEPLPRRVSRFGGGDWRRPGRHYRTTICRPCAERIVAESGGSARNEQWDRYNVRSVERALEGEQ